MRMGWDRQRFEDCFRLKSGDNLTSKSMDSKGIYPVFGGNGIAGYHNHFNLSGNNVIIGRVGALCGNARNITDNIWLTDNAFKIVDYKFEFDNRFLTYLLNYKNLRFYARQAAQPVISNSSLKDVVLEFPKLVSEQIRIVEILDETFAAIDKAKVNIEKNLCNAKELFESKKSELFEHISLEKKVLLSSVCSEIFAGGDAPKKGNYSLTKTKEFKIPIIANAVENNGLYGYTNYARVTKPSISIAARGSGTGHTEIRRDPFLPIVRLIVLIPKEIIDINFLMYSVQSLRIVRSGSAIPQLTVPMIKSYEIRLPNINKQLEIVFKLDHLKAELEKIESLYNQKLAILEELKRSFLRRAFSGELSALTKTLVHE